MVGKNGHVEGIYNKVTGKLVGRSQDDTIMGIFNFAPSDGLKLWPFIKHYDMDMRPYYKWEN